MEKLSIQEALVFDVGRDLSSQKEWLEAAEQLVMAKHAIIKLTTMLSLWSRKDTSRSNKHFKENFRKFVETREYRALLGSLLHTPPTFADIKLFILACSLPTKILAIFLNRIELRDFPILLRIYASPPDLHENVLLLYLSFVEDVVNEDIGRENEEAVESSLDKLYITSFVDHFKNAVEKTSPIAEDTSWSLETGLRAKSALYFGVDSAARLIPDENMRHAWKASCSSRIDALMKCFVLPSQYPQQNGKAKVARLRELFGTWLARSLQESVARSIEGVKSPYTTLMRFDVPLDAHIHYVDLCISASARDILVAEMGRQTNVEEEFFSERLLQAATLAPNPGLYLYQHENGFDYVLRIGVESGIAWGMMDSIFHSQG